LVFKIVRLLGIHAGSAMITSYPGRELRPANANANGQVRIITTVVRVVKCGGVGARRVPTNGDTRVSSGPNARVGGAICQDATPSRIASLVFKIVRLLGIHAGSAMITSYPRRELRPANANANGQVRVITTVVRVVKCGGVAAGRALSNAARCCACRTASAGKGVVTHTVELLTRTRSTRPTIGTCLELAMIRASTTKFGRSS
jgi:hypothetical protein